MQNFYKHYPEIDNVYWTNYFLNNFIPKNLDSILKSSYVMYYKKDFNKNLEILKLSALLTNKLKFPPIEYNSIFRHIADQPIHADGINAVRNASFNLPLLGFERTQMCFYNTKSNAIPKRRDAFFFEKEDVDLVTKLKGCNNWVLVNSSIPHNIENVDVNNPRLTACIRFSGNPTFEDLIKN